MSARTAYRLRTHRHRLHRAAQSVRQRRGGRLAQLVERLVYTENVGGSSPSPPTIISNVLIFYRLSLPDVYHFSLPDKKHYPG